MPATSPIGWSALNRNGDKEKHREIAFRQRIRDLAADLEYRT